MKKEKIKQLPVVKEFTDYFVRRAKRALKIKNAEFQSISIDIFMRSGRIGIWFHGKDSEIIARAKFMSDGRLDDIFDKRKLESEPEMEVVTQGKPEDA